LYAVDEWLCVVIKMLILLKEKMVQENYSGLKRLKMTRKLEGQVVWSHEEQPDVDRVLKKLSQEKSQVRPLFLRRRRSMNSLL